MSLQNSIKNISFSNIQQKNPQISSQRLNTEEMFPNFRKNYEIIELQEEISKLKLSLQLKDKEIHYLSTQTVSLKSQFTSQLLVYENTLAEQKKQLTELRYLGLKDKRAQNEKHDKYIFQLKSGYQLQISQLKKGFEKKTQNLISQHRKQLSNFHLKMSGLLQIEKRQNKALEEMKTEKQKNYEKNIQQYKDQIQNLMRDKTDISADVKQYERALEKIKEELKNYTQSALDRERENLIEIEKLKEEKKHALKKAEKYFIEIESNKEEFISMMEIKEMKINQLEEEIKELRELVDKKDQDLSTLLRQRSKNSSREKEKKKVDLVYACNHQGLIEKLQKNIRMKQKQNKQLESQLQRWGLFIGFDKQLGDRTSQLLNASSQALQTQSNFRNNLKKLSKNL